MNRSSNLLNGALLSSSGRATKVFMQASQWCQAQASALLLAGRKLQTETRTNNSVSFLVRVGRGLKVAAFASSALVFRLAGLSSVSLIAAMQVTGNFVGTLRVYRASKLASISSAYSEFVAKIQNIHPLFLAANTSLSVTTEAKLNKYVQLKAYCTQADTLVTTGVLSESSKLRAPSERIVYIPGTSRVSIIPGI